MISYFLNILIYMILNTKYYRFENRRMFIEKSVLLLSKLHFHGLFFFSNSYLFSFKINLISFQFAFEYSFAISHFNLKKKKDII